MDGDSPSKWSKVRRVLAHPLIWLVVFLTITQQVREWYPFSHYPMYSNPGNKEFYLYIADEEGTPLAIKFQSGVTAPKVKKRWKSRLKELGVHYNDSYAEEHEQAGKELLASLRKVAVDRKRPLPVPVKLIRVDIRFENDEFTETESVVATEGGKAR